MIRESDFVAFGSGDFVLREVNVDFITIKIGVVCLAVGVVKSDGLFLGEDANLVSHNTVFVCFVCVVLFLLVIQKTKEERRREKPWLV